MTEIKDLENEMMTIEDAVDNNKQETIESLIQDLTFYHLVFTDGISTSLNYSVESNKLLASFESIQDSNFNLLALAHLSDFPTKDFSGKNLIKL